MNNGWIKLHRKLLENPICNNSNYLSLWIHLLLMANHKDNKLMWNKEIIIIKEGQLLTGRKELSKKTGISQSTIERILKVLESGHQIEQQKTNKFRIITIVKWDSYQKMDKTMDNKWTTSGQQVDTNNKDNKEKNVNKVDTKVSTEQAREIKKLFDMFYKINPSLNWGNLAIRKGAVSLINKFGLEETLRMAEAVISIQGQQYAPVATNPLHMWNKLAEFKIYFDKEKNNKANNLFIKIS